VGRYLSVELLESLYVGQQRRASRGGTSRRRGPRTKLASRKLD
jgi:hypothetical protein